MKTFLALATLASIAATPAMAEKMTRDGLTYDYNVRTVGNSTLISGEVVDTGESFRLRVKNGRVSGHMGWRSVNFRTDDVESAQSASTVLAAK